MSSLKHVTRMAAHAAGLIFGAFWLVATSSPNEPARDCFTGIANPTRLQVVLGQIQSSTGSCGGLDGITPDSTLVFDLSQGPRPLNVGGSCWAYATEALTGPTGVTLPSPGVSASSSDALTIVTGSFDWPEQSACRGYWTLDLRPEKRPLAGQPTSPLDAGFAQPWFVERYIGVEQAQFCGATFAAPGSASCSERFAVVSITELAAP